MLYYSGFTRRIGNVDEGSTVTDFLPAERARGITIQSAAVTFHWPPTSNVSVQLSPNRLRQNQHTVNLIDTPGHADFTFEVIRSLRILDGAICILDGVAGVEAQTEKVWHQANGYAIPRIIYVNKLDRDGAAFRRTVSEIASRLHSWPALCQIPWWKKGRFVGIGDVISLCGLQWEADSDGSEFKTFTLEDLQAVDSEFADELRRARIALIEVLTEQDDEMVESFLDAEEDCMQISDVKIWNSLRKSVLSKSQAITPVFAGASFRNIGIQPLLEAVNTLLPSPTEILDPEISLGQAGASSLRKLLRGQLALDEPEPSSKRKPHHPVQRTAPNAKMQVQNLVACALAFKVVTDAKRGVLVYVRVYSGSIDRGCSLFNTNLSVSERATRLLRMYASEALEIERIEEGQIGVIPGLKHARTGDTLIVYSGASVKTGPPAPIKSLQLRPIDVPPPVFFTSVEPHSLSEEKHLNDAIALLLREDPSLKVTQDPETGQTHLAGMGELHLEIARDRLINDFKVKATTGKIEISYREAITEASADCTETIDREIGGKQTAASCRASVSPVDPSSADTTEDRQGYVHRIGLEDSNNLFVHTPSLTRDGTPIEITDALIQAPPLPPALPIQAILSALQIGASAALARGPSHHLPVHSTNVFITVDPAQHLTSTSTSGALSSSARAAVQAAMRQSASEKPTAMMEPVMQVAIAVPETVMGAVVHDLSSARGGHVLSLDAEEEEAIDVPRLSENQLKRVYSPPDPFGSGDGSATAVSTNVQRLIKARVPLKEMVGYLKHLRSLTAGRGTFVMSVDRFERMSAQRAKTALAEMRGDLGM